MLPSIRIEGAILSADILGKLGTGDVSGQRPADFGCKDATGFKEDLLQAWTSAQAYYRAFRAKVDRLPETSPATTETRNLWIIPLLGLLGYSELEFQQSADVVGDKPFRFSHRLRSHGGFVVHAVGARDSLDRKVKGKRAGADESSRLRESTPSLSPSFAPASSGSASPHGLVQEYLNLTEHLYALVTNGRVLRLLRDSTRLVKLSYVEFDLDRMFEEELFADFSALYRLLHVSRLPKSPDTSAQSLLERYHQDALDAGSAIREKLGAAVRQAMQDLGSGFLLQNPHLQEAAASKTLQPVDFHRSILRLVYRLLFLMTAEERRLLFPHDADPRLRSIYEQHYSMARLRRLAERRHLVEPAKHDLWVSLLSTFSLFEVENAGAPLGLTALCGHLFSADALGVLRTARLDNATFLSALTRLSVFREEKSGQLIRVNYGAMETEEFGSVYEGLLELHPVFLDGTPPHFGFKQAAGNERKTTGSYYTPSSLVECLLDSALDPVVEERLRRWKDLGYESSRAALLALNVCDPACGSGHFLIAAAQRIARKLATLDSPDSEPSPDQLRHALREVISHCLYGVDMNPMAAELCRMSLWLEALEPGKPLSFLDHHIRVGNSLLGTTPALIAAGLPGDAFTAIEGDDKDACRELKQLNAREVGGYGELFAGEDNTTHRRLREAADVVEAMPDDTPEHVRQKSAAFARAQANDEYRTARDLGNAWCAAFVIRKKLRDPNNPGSGLGLTQRHLNDIANGRGLPADLQEEVTRLCLEYGFFHWHLAFPEVFSLGGFDCMLGNPPWDTMSPDAKEFFAAYESEVRVQDKAAQTATIERLLESPAIAARWEQTRRHIFASVHFIKNSGRYLLFAEGNLGKGDFNIYRMFVELALQTTRPDGSASQFVPEGLYNGANCAAVRKALFSTCRLTWLLGFENTREVWFKDVHPALKFCLYVARVGGETDSFLGGFNIRSVERLTEMRAGRALRVPVTMVYEFSPEALAVMEFGDQREIDIAAKMYARCPKFGDESAGPPKRTFMREFDMGNDREVFGNDPNGLPLYEGRMVDQFDHRAKGYRSGRGRSAVWPELEFGKPGKSIQPQWRVPLADISERVRGRMNRYRVGFCDVTSPTNERSLIAALLPPGTVSGDKVPTILFTGVGDWTNMVWLAVANSFAMDFLARKKVALKMSYTVLDSLPFPRLTKDDPLARRIVPLALRLTCCGPEMIAYWNACANEGWIAPVPADGPPPGAEDELERLHLRADLDTIIARDVFGLTASEMEYILETFSSWKQREQKRYGEFRTKRLILEAFATGAELPTPVRVASPDVSAAPLPQLPATQRPAFKSSDYFQHILPLIARLQPEGVEAGRLLHALEILAESEPRRAALDGRNDGPWKQWAASFPRRHAFSDAAAALIVLLGDSTLSRWQGRIKPAPDAHFVEEAWLNTDAFLALRLALDAPAEAVQRSRAETVKRFPELAILLLAA